MEVKKSPQADLENKAVCHRVKVVINDADPLKNISKDHHSKYRYGCIYTKNKTIHCIFLRPNFSRRKPDFQETV